MTWEVNIRDFTNAASAWNRNIFGHIQKKKRRILNRLRVIHRSLAEEPNLFLDDLLQHLWWEYEIILFEEESFWMQRARCKWISQEDKNTRYFHLSTLVRRRRNKVLALKDNDGNWVHDSALLKSMIRDYFLSLYCGTQSGEAFPLRGCFPTVSASDWTHIYRPLSVDEIKSTLFSMGGLKAPGPDGLHALFFQSQWSIVGDSVYAMVSDIFHNPERVKEINQTFITLVPKVEHPESVKHFRPISLCNVIYKIVTKIIANRLQLIMPMVIAPTQCGFIRNRSGSHSIIVAQEVIHKMRSTKGKKGFMAIKLDLEKAYDRLDWRFVIDSLRDLGINEHFSNLIWHCISSVSMDILWNGDRTGDFFPTRGIRQGDPLSPYLFVICIERLSHLIQAAVDEGFWKPITLSRDGPPITHLCFADDLFIFAEASMDQVEVIKCCL